MSLPLSKILATGILAACAATAAASAPLWLRDVKISPDGTEIAFTYHGDIYKVAASGGRAVRLTTVDSYESEPIWSPDGKSIAFASDRHGSLDVFVMPAAGGPAKRLTSYSGTEIPEAFSPDGKSVLFSSAIQDPVESATFPSGRLTELYSVPTTGGRVEQLLATPAQMIAHTPDGKSFVYQDVKGMENEWRKHHTSSVTRDLWRYDYATKRHTKLTEHAGEDRNPVVSPDGKTLYFLSERDGGSMNVYAAPLADASKATPLTSFSGHPVRFLSQGSNGLLAMAFDGEIYTMRPGSKPEKVEIEIIADDYNPVEFISIASGSEGAVPSPDGKQVAFVKRGEVFVTSVDYATTRQITSTPAAEYELSWGSDNRSLYYTSERDGLKAIYRARIGRDADTDFAHATSVIEEPVFPSDGTERNAPAVSPDGKKLAYMENRCRLMVTDLPSADKSKLLAGGKEKFPHGDIEFDWSPDSRFITFSLIANGRDPYSDIALVNVDGDPQVTLLTQTAYIDGEPVWSRDGGAILFKSNRYGLRSHASWGSQDDIMAVFVNREALERFNLSEEDMKLRKEEEKAAKSAADEGSDSDKKKTKEKKGTAKKTDDEPLVTVERDGIEDRVVRLTPWSGDMSGMVADKDFETLYFLCATDKGYDLWKKDLRKGDVTIAKRFDIKGANLLLDADASAIFVLGNGVMKKVSIPGEKTDNITASGRMKLDRAMEREAMFNQVCREEKERFYTTSMHGVDWDAMTAHYRKFLPHIINNYDFAEMLSEMLGELNVSHTGSGYNGHRADEQSASLGLLYDLSYTGAGMRVAEIVQGGPFDKSDTRLKVGDVITSVNGAKIDASTDMTSLFNGLVGKRTLVGFGNGQEEVIKPISTSAFNQLLYRRWVRSRAAEVDRLSGGRLGYVHIRSMADASYRDIYSDILGKYNTREGIVIDTRWNGGGRLHEDIEVLFSGQKYLTQEVRGVDVCDMPSRRWNKPSIMITCEADYSNAHGTPWVYKTRGIGRVVGMPVPGTMTSVNWVTLQDPSLYFGIPVIGYRTAEGTYLENSQLEPDIRVANDPASVVKGEDRQLRTAVTELLREIDAARK